MKETLKQIETMENSQNHVIKDCHDKMKQMHLRMKEIEKTDFDDKFNHITRRMIADVVRDLLTPVQLTLSLEIKDIKKHVEDHFDRMEHFEEELKMFKNELQSYSLVGKYDLQNNKKESEAYMRELLRLQKLDHIRVQVSQHRATSQ